MGGHADMRIRTVFSGTKPFWIDGSKSFVIVKKHHKSFGRKIMIENVNQSGCVRHAKSAKSTYSSDG